MMASVQDLLEANSTKKYYIEYQDYLSNHVADAIVALSRLGVTDGRLQKFVEHYTTRLESSEAYTAENKRVKLSLEELKGKRVAYYVILQDYLDAGEASSTLEDLIRDKFDQLSLGILGSAFHGLIQTGYGYSAGNQRVVCEGLAYLHHSYFPLDVSHPEVLKEPLGTSGDTDILDVFKLFHRDRDMYDMMVHKSTTQEDEILQNVGEAFGPKTGALFAFRGDDLLRYVNKIKLPEFYDPKKDTVSQLEPLLKWLIDCAITVYVMAETRNDFFLLHGVTAAWALRNILPLIRDVGTVNQTVRVFLCGLLATYMSQDCPTLNPKFLPSQAVGMFSWERIIELTVSKTDRDEHIYKLVQVCHDMSVVNSDHQMAGVYKEATQVALMYPFVF